MSTKPNRLMRHVHHYPIHLGCLLPGLSEENEIEHKEFKCLYKGTNNHIDSTTVQLLTSCVQSPYIDAPVLTGCPTYSTETWATLYRIFQSSFSSTTALVHDISGSTAHTDITHKILQLNCNGKSLFAGNQVYDMRHRHEAVLYSVQNEQQVGIVEAIFSFYSNGTVNCPKLVLLRCRHLINPDPGNVSVVETFGSRLYAHSLSNTCHIKTDLIQDTTLLKPIRLFADQY